MVNAVYICNFKLEEMEIESIKVKSFNQYSLPVICCFLLGNKGDDYGNEE